MEKFQTRRFISRALDFDTIIPCQLLDIAKLRSREDVFKKCQDIREEFLSKGIQKSFGKGKARSLRIPIPLIEELKIFLNADLAELIDNTRIHKHASTQNFASLYMRFRRREERLYGANKEAEPNWARLTELKKSTFHFWYNDIVEVVYADTGDSIQDTFIKGWEKRHVGDKRKIARLPSGERVDGPNGDGIILRNIFEDNLSSLSEIEREREHLPKKLTGLHSLKMTIANPTKYFSVISGRNYLCVGNFLEKKTSGKVESKTKVRLAGRLGKFTGVHYFFRFTSSESRALTKWSDSIGKNNIANDAHWWRTAEPNEFSGVEFISNYSIPENLPPNTVVICRANHPPHKSQILHFLNRAKEKHYNLIFAELSPPIALYLYQQMELLLKYEEIDIICPIVTNTFHVQIPGKGNNRYSKYFNRVEEVSGEQLKVWFTQPSSPIRDIADLFRCCRYEDSIRFWDEIAKEQMAFIPNPVIWSDNLKLTGGYLSIEIGLKKPLIQKLMRKRLLIAAYALRVTDVKPYSDSMRYITNEVRSNLFAFDKRIPKIAILSNVIAKASKFRNQLQRSPEENL
ncbi:MAG: hypothetical protein KC592_20380, partial [Nitrospira sp.]|nr:hypothetical protein [Nitrospira sp.]